MRTACCDCCRTGTDACSLDVLKAAGWSLVEHAEGEALVLLCPVCTWERTRAAQAVSVAMEAAAAAPVSLMRNGRRPKSRGWWFWS